MPQKWTNDLIWFPKPAALNSNLTHLIQIICSLEVSSVQEPCSNWHAPYIGFIKFMCTFNGIYTFALNCNHDGISCDVPFAGHLRSNRTNVWSDKRNIQNVQSGGGVRGLELRTAALNPFLLIPTNSPCFSLANTECYLILFHCSPSYVIPLVVNGNSNLPQLHSSSNIKSLLALCQ